MALRKLQKIVVENWLLFAKAELDLTEDGVYVISGRNRDRPGGPGKTTNGVGKSMLASLIPQIRFGSPPMPMKSKKIAKDGFTKATKQTIVIEDNLGVEHEIRRYMQGTVKTDFFTGNKLKKFRKAEDAKKYLKSLLPTNEDQYYTLEHLDTKKPSVFQYGTGAQRHEFIEKLYGLDIYDQLAAVVKKDFQRTSTASQDQKLLKSQLLQKQADLPKGYQNVDTKLELETKRVEGLRQSVTTLQESLQDIRSFKAVSHDITTTDSLQELQDKRADGQLRLDSIKKQIDKAVRVEQQIQAYRQVEIARKSLTEQLEQLKDVVVDKSAQEKLSSLKSKRNSLEELQEEQEQISGSIRKTKKYLADIEIAGKDKKMAEDISAKKLQKAMQKEEGVIKELEKQLQTTKEHLEHSSDNCPVCSAALEKGFVKRYLAEQEQTIEAARSKKERFKAMFYYARELANIKEAESKVKAVENPETLDQEIEQVEELLKGMRKKVLLKAKLKELPQLETADPIDVKPLEEKREKIEKKQRSLDKQITLVQNRDRLKSTYNSLEDALAIEAKYEKEYEELQPLLSESVERHSNLSAKSTQIKMLTQDIEQLTAKIEKLDKEAQEAEVFAALRDAFGARGIRKQRVADISKSIETSLNIHASNFFDFPIKFELVVKDDDFQILAYRNKQVTDVRRLSGAESRCFSILTLMALLDLCDPSQRIDTVFLDEVEANLDGAFREKYIHQFIPLLLEVVPKVVVITPLSPKELYIPNAKRYTVIKHNNKSKLVKEF